VWLVRRVLNKRRVPPMAVLAGAERRERCLMIVPIVVGAALFMQFLDSTAIVIVLPEIAASLNTDPANLSLAITIYFLMVAIFIPASGWAADNYGARTVFQVALAVFTLSSVACGLSSTFTELIIARAVQGSAAALMTPVARLILLHSFPRSDLVRVMTWFSYPALIGPMLGAPLGGFLATYYSWHWIFFINLPVGVIAIIISAITVKNYRSAEPRPFEWVGFMLIAATVTAAIGAMQSLGGGSARHYALAAGLALVAGAFGLLTWRHARGHPQPLLDLSLQRLPTFRLSNGGGFLYRVALNGTLMLLPMLVQTGFGMTAAQSSIFALCGAVGLFLIRPRVRHILQRFGFRSTLFWNGLASAASVAVFCVFTATTPLVLTGIGFLICGISRSLQYMSLSTVVFSDVPAAQSSRATSIVSMAEQFAGAMGTSLAGIVLQLSVLSRGVDSNAMNAADIQYGLAAMAAVALLSALVVLKLHPDAGMEVSGKKSAKLGVTNKEG